MKVVDNFLDHFAKLLIDFHRVVPVNACDEVRTLTNVDLVLVAPFDPAMVFVDRFHFGRLCSCDILTLKLKITNKGGMALEVLRHSHVSRGFDMATSEDLRGHATPNSLPSGGIA
jgi:hypothetical protein